MHLLQTKGYKMAETELVNDAREDYERIVMEVDNTPRRLHLQYDAQNEYIEREMIALYGDNWRQHVWYARKWYL